MLDVDVLELFECVFRCKLACSGTDGMSDSGSIMTLPAKRDTRFGVERRLDRIEVGEEGVINCGEVERDDHGVVDRWPEASCGVGVTNASGSSVKLGTCRCSLEGWHRDVFEGLKHDEDEPAASQVGEFTTGDAEMLLTSIGELSKSSVTFKSAVCISGEHGAESPPFSRQSNPLPDL